MIVWITSGISADRNWYSCHKDGINLLLNLFEVVMRIWWCHLDRIVGFHRQYESPPCFLFSFDKKRKRSSMCIKLTILQWGWEIVAPLRYHSVYFKTTPCTRDGEVNWPLMVLGSRRRYLIPFTLWHWFYRYWMVLVKRFWSEWRLIMVERTIPQYLSFHRIEYVDVLSYVYHIIDFVFTLDC